MPPKLSSLIDRHERYYKRNEKKDFDKARRFYRGDFYSTKRANVEHVDRLLLCSKNLIYAIADTAVSSLLGPNPQVACVPRNPQSQDAMLTVNGLMEFVFDENRMRRRAATALIDAVLCKRGIFKTGWNSKKDRPVIKSVDPSRLFFDLTVRDVDDISYWIEVTVISYEEFKNRVVSGVYQIPPGVDIQPDRYPSWLVTDAQKGDVQTVRDAFQWVTVYEYYNVEEGTVQHYVKQADTVIFEDKIDYVPYSMFSLNQSGIDCTGLSEVQLVLNQQETVNDLLSHLKEIAYLQIPRILYDAGRITEEDLNKAVAATTGSFVGIRPENSEALRTLNTLFFPMPTPDTPASVVSFVDRQENDAAFISALAEAARGQVAGARTATEMAIIDAQMRTRLATREGHLNDAIEDVGRKAFYLMRKYMTGEKMVRISGSRNWEAVSFATLQDVDMDFKMVSYNPVRKNPAVMVESIIQMLPFLAQNPNVDFRMLTEQVIAGLGFPSRMLKSEEMLEQEQQAAMQQQEQAVAAEQQRSLGGAAAGAPALAAEAIAQDDAEAAAASGELSPDEELLASLPPEIAELLLTGAPQGA
jgi:hypothetical protein